MSACGPTEATRAIVKVVRLPQGEPGPDGKPAKVGLDDFLVACKAKGLNPAGELRKLLDQAEDPTPPVGGTIKEKASEMDSVLAAHAFLTTTERDGVPRLRHWRGIPLYWRQGAYRELQPLEVRGELIEHLDKQYFKLTQSATSNVLDALKAISRLPYHIEPPAWISDKPQAWNSARFSLVEMGWYTSQPLLRGKRISCARQQHNSSRNPPLIMTLSSHPQCLKHG